MTSARLSGLVRELGELLVKRGETLAIAESCTGGWVGKIIVDCNGSSAWFSAALVTYSNESKHRLLGVREKTLGEHGAISGETALEMADGALDRTGAHWSLAVTGIAGPGGGTPTKPVGTVWFAWAGRNGLKEAERQHFEGDRRAVRASAVQHALEGLLSRVRAISAR